MDKHSDNLLFEIPAVRMFLTTLLTEYELENTEQFFVRYDKLRRWFETKDRFVKSLFRLEEMGLYEIKGCKSATGSYTEMDSAQRHILSIDTEAWLAGSQFDIKIDRKKIISVIYREKSSDRSKSIQTQKYEIKKITLVKGEGRDGCIIIDDDFSENVLDVDFGKPTWTLLLRLANKEEVIYDPKSNKSSYDYINHNRTNQIYTHLKCEPQKLLKIVGGMIKPSITITEISNKAFVTRLNKISA